MDKKPVLRIEVTSLDVQAALDARMHTQHYNSEKECPIAQALWRMGYFAVRVHPDFLSTTRKPYHWMMPEQWEATPTMRRAMREFDRFGRFAPHTFVTRPY